MSAPVTSICAGLTASVDATYAPLTSACAEHGISRNTAYRLMHDGLLDTFTIRSRRYVYLESLRTLPERLALLEAA